MLYSCCYVALMIMKALDIVRTPKGGIAFITETNNEGTKASINYIGDLNVGDEHNAWWSKSDLEVISSIPSSPVVILSFTLGRSLF